MKLTKSHRESIAKVHQITSLIQKKLKEKDSEIKKSVDLSRVASDLAERRERAMKSNEG